MTTYIIFDISNLIHRIRHSIVRYDNSSELVASVLHSFFLSLNKSYRQFDADHLVACFDASEYWREWVYPDYKLSRKVKKLTRTPAEKEEDAKVYEMIEYLYEFLDQQTNVTVLREYGMEADDFIARWTQVHPDDTHIIVSTDSDFKQLVSNTITQYDPRVHTLYTINGVFHQDGNRITRKDIVTKLYGDTWKVKHDKNDEIVTFDPEWELFFKIIRGDTSDYIKSAYPRVREKRLKGVFAHRGSLDWNNFMGEQWDSKDDSSPIVRDKYQFNETLIDLTKQPDEIKELLDETIEKAIDKKPKPFATIAFGKFCRRHRLPKLMDYISTISKAISARYQ